MVGGKGFGRVRALQVVVIFIFTMLVGRVFYLQVIDSRYRSLSDGNVLRHEVAYPTRGEVFDRNGEYLVMSRGCYDMMVIYKELSRDGFDTTMLCRVLKITPDKLTKALKNARMRPRAPYMITNFVSTEDKLLFDECGFKGFHGIYRTVREYPRQVGGNLLGHVGEVSPTFLKNNPEYVAGDYVGTNGVESAYEHELRGEKGVHITKVDTHGAKQGSYLDGLYDTLPRQGKYLVSTIDAKLQLLGEELMQGKVGAAVAIEPSTGEILMMVSSPTFNPDELVGRQRGNHYMELLNNKRRPLFNRSVSARYPPGSTFKLLQGLVGMQEGVLVPSMQYSCHGGFSYGNRKLGCHAHASPLALQYAVATSCNAYFCYVFRNILDNKKYGSTREAYDVWRDYVLSFGFGRKLGSDFLGEGNGHVPESSYFDRIYRRSWNPLTVISLSIGQGELGCTPLQMANFAATIANRGYYYIPHIVKEVEGQDSLDQKFREKHYTKVDPKYFDPIIDGMWDAVNKSGSATRARLDGYDVCGKTGTAENPHGADHSTFLSFAPKDNPKIAISVYVENGGFGATIALPIASLIEEQFLTGEIKRTDLLKYVKSKVIRYPNYE
ncbi:MAG: penicillin-binding transpeptidase domain-containing protein [Rikenellaceae bacterium]